MRFILSLIICLMMAAQASALEWVYSASEPVNVQLQGGKLTPTDIGLVDVETDGGMVQQYRFHLIKTQDTNPTQGQIDQYKAADVDVQRDSLKHPEWLARLPESEIKDAVAPLIQGGVLKSNLSVAEWTEIVGQYPVWATGLSVEPDIVYRYDNQLYRSIQAHTTQSDWTPDIVPALFALSMPPSVIADWVQPTGAHDAYQIGDQVQFNGQVYESKINANVWSPAVYPAGWKLIE